MSLPLVNMSTIPIESRQSTTSLDSECGSRDSSTSCGNSNRPRAFVQHNYHDHADVVCTSNVAFVTRGGVATQFPLKLYHMLLHAEADGITDIVGWQPHGRAFVVRRPKEFAAFVLPRYFGKMKFASFQRQLNLYGFLRLTQGQDKGGYYHEFFLRHREFLCVRIQRMRVKGTGARAANNPAAEPDLYSLPYVTEQLSAAIEISPLSQPQALQPAPSLQALAPPPPFPGAVLQQQQQQQEQHQPVDEPLDYSSASDDDEVDMNILSEFLLDQDEVPPKISARPQLSHQGSLSSLCSEETDDGTMPLRQPAQLSAFPSKLPTLDMEELCFLQGLFGTKEVESAPSYGDGNANNAASAIHSDSGRRRSSIRRSLTSRAA